jgi:hypothetical protein
MELPTTFESILLAELRLGVPATSFFKISQGTDDWTLVLRLQAYMEGATHALVKARNTELIQQVNEFDTYVSKLNVAFTLPELIDDQNYKRFLIALNSLRNKYAHNPAFIYQSLKNFFLAGTYPRTENGLVAFSKDISAGRELLKKHPRMLLLIGCAFALDLFSLAVSWRRTGDTANGIEDYSGALQDILHDPAVIELKRAVERSKLQ